MVGYDQALTTRQRRRPVVPLLLQISSHSFFFTIAYALSSRCPCRRCLGHTTTTVTPSGETNLLVDG